MRLMSLMMTLCATLSVSACVTPTEQAGPLFSEIQRVPPPVAAESADRLVRTEREFAVWLAETNSNCISFGCLE